MTRLITDGAEMGDVLGWDYAYAITLSTPYSGVYSYHMNGGSGSTCHRYFTPISEGYFRMRLYQNGSCRWLSIFGIYSGGTSIAYLQLTDTYQIRWVVGAAQVGISAEVVSPNVWYLIEGRFKLADTGGICQLKVNSDPALWIDYTGDTKPGANTTFNKWYMGGIGSNYGDCNIDDLALNDTSGSIDNSWCGPGRVGILKPNNDGDVLEWTPSTSGSHYSLVDDIPSTGDTDYVHAEGDNLKDMYHLQSYDETNKTVDRIWVEGRAKDYSGSGTRIGIGVKTSGSVLVTDAGQLPSSFVSVKSQQFTESPLTGNKWSKAELDAIQIVIDSESS